MKDFRYHPWRRRERSTAEAHSFCSTSLLPQRADPSALSAWGRSVCVETPFDVATTADQIVLSVRRAEWHDGGRADVELERALVTLSLGTRRYSARDATADRFLGEHRSIVDSLEAFGPRIGPS